MQQRVVPTLRIASYRERKAFYELLGFAEQWTHQFEPGFPIFASMVRDGMQIFLTEHTGDCQFGGLVHFHVDDVDAVHREWLGRDVVPLEAPHNDLGPGAALHGHHRPGWQPASVHDGVVAGCLSGARREPFSHNLTRITMSVLARFIYDVRPGRMQDFMSKLAEAASPRFDSHVMPTSVKLLRPTVPGPDTGRVILHIEYADMAAYGARTAFEQANPAWRALFEAMPDSPETLVSVELLTEFTPA